jgi:hypothetical protein
MRPALMPSLAALAGCAVLFGACQAAAQGYITSGLGLNVFFSPSGQPFRGKPGEAYPVKTWFEAADADHDGKVSHDEFDAMKFYGLLDVNHDGYINSPENTRYESQVAPEIQHMDPRILQPKIRQGNSDSDPNFGADTSQSKGSGKYIKQIIGASQYGMIDEPQPVRAADANFDFRVSSDEWINASHQRFTILDLNGDGFLTPDELRTTPAQAAAEAESVDSNVKAGKGKKKHSGLW